MNIVAYCRVSTDADSQLNSLETQKQFFKEYAEKNNHNLVKTYADEGISGTKIKNRKQFLQLMKDSNSGLFSMVVVKDISRFARNAVDFLQSIRELKAKGIPCNFITANLSTEDGEMVLGMLAIMAQEESANTSKRIKFSKKMNAEKGRVPNIVYGYDKTKGDYFNLAVNEYEANIIRRIFNLYLNDGYGANKIAQILNTEGIKTKRGYKWSQNGISRILTNALYCGKIINGKEEVADFLTGVRTEKDESEWYIVDKPELRIIEDETLVKASGLLASRNDSFSISHERQSNKHLFSTLIKCSCCGYSFRRTVRVYKNTYVKWVCSGRNVNGKISCNNSTSIDEQELQDAIKAYFVGILENKKDAIKSVAAEFNSIYHTKDENAEYEQELTVRLAKANKSRQKYMDMYDDDLITREELREKLSAFNIEIGNCENELKIINYNSGKGDRLEQEFSSTFKDMESILSMEDMTNAQLKRVIDKIVVDEHGKIKVNLKLLSDIGLERNALISDNRT